MCLTERGTPSRASRNVSRWVCQERRGPGLLSRRCTDSAVSLHRSFPSQKVGIDDFPSPESPVTRQRDFTPKLSCCFHRVQHCVKQCVIVSQKHTHRHRREELVVEMGSNGLLRFPFSLLLAGQGWGLAHFTHSPRQVCKSRQTPGPGLFCPRLVLVGVSPTGVGPLSKGSLSP